MSDAVRTIKGWFWFPPDQERAFGTLELEPRALRLRLRDSPKPGFEPMDEVIVIHGESLKDDDLTMLGARLSGRSSGLTSGHNVERYRGHTVLIGAHVLSEDELPLDRATVQLRGMTEWMGDGSHGVSPYAAPRVVRPAPRGLLRLAAWWKRWRTHDPHPRREGLPKPLEVPLNDATLTFGYDVGTSYHEYEETTRLQASARVTFPSPISLTEWREQWSRPLLDFFVFVTREQIVTELFTISNYNEDRVARLHPAIRRAATDRFWATQTVEVIRQAEVDVRPRGITPFQHQLLPLGVLGSDAPAVLAKFFDIHRKLGGTALVLFAVLNTRTIFEENRLLNLMAFCEGYHRLFFDEPQLAEEQHRQLRTAMLDAIPKQYKNVYNGPLQRAHQQTQRQRLKWLIARAADVDDYFDDPNNVLRDQLVNTRNDLTHQNEPGEDALPFSELYDRVERLIQVIEINLMVDLGVSTKTISELVKGAHARQPKQLA
jgi:hypothetical protein